MKKIFIIHGWEGYPEEGWFPWLKKKLEEKEFYVEIPAMPNTNHPKVSDWIGHIRKIAESVNENTYFVGHSLGCVSIARYLEKLTKDKKVGGCVFVAGFSGNIHIKEISEFYSLPLNFDNVRIHTKKFVTILSTNDKYISLERGKEFQQILNAKLIIEKNKGHFSSGDGIKELPIVLNSIMEMIKK